MTDDTWPKTRRADPLMTTIDRAGRGGTVIAPCPRATASLLETIYFHVSQPTNIVRKTYSQYFRRQYLGSVIGSTKLGFKHPFSPQAPICFEPEVGEQRGC